MITPPEGTRSRSRSALPIGDRAPGPRSIIADPNAPVRAAVPASCHS